MRYLFAVIVGALVYFGAGVLSWMVFPWHQNSIHTLPEEQLIRDTLSVTVPESGVYVFPSKGTDPAIQTESKLNEIDPEKKGEEFGNAAGFLAVYPSDPPVLGSRHFGVAGLIALGASIFMVVLFWLSRLSVKTVAGRLLLAMGSGALVWFVADLSNWNWFYFSAEYTGVYFFDRLFTFGMLGLSLAKLVPFSFPMQSIGGTKKEAAE